MRDISRRQASLGVLIASVIALGLRLWGIEHGLPHPTTRPDEERIVGRALHIIATGDFNPMNYTYPAAMIHLEALGIWLYATAGRVLGWYQEMGDFLMDVAVYRPGLQYRIARTVSASMGALTVWVVYRLARERALPRWGSVLAATILGTNYLHVRDSHFATVDIGAAMFIAASLLFAVRASRTQRPFDYIVAAILGGVATATKYNAGILCLPILVATAYGYFHRRRNLAESLGILLMCAVAMATSFAIASPYNVMNIPATIRAAGEVQTVLYGAETPRALWTHLSATFPIGYGWVVYLLSATGLAIAIAGRARWDMVILAFVLPTLWTSMTVRWSLPRYLIFVAPMMAIWAASTIRLVANRWSFAERGPRLRVIAATLVTVLACGAGVRNSIRFDRIAARKDTRVLTAEWADMHLPARSAVVVCRGYGAPVLNTDRRRARPFEPRLVACASAAAADTDAQYLITHQHPFLERYSNPSEDLIGRLRRDAQPLVTFQPFRLPFIRDHVAATSKYYDHDAFYLPFGGLEHVERSGPIVRVWKLR